jgi:PBP1b-binding outer membrane lipoprotein LpoB
MKKLILIIPLFALFLCGCSTDKLLTIDEQIEQTKKCVDAGFKAIPITNFNEGVVRINCYQLSNQ